MLCRRRLLLAAPALLLPKAARSFAAIGQPSIGGPFDVFLIGGQSNAVGHGQGFDSTLDAPNLKVFAWNYWLQKVVIADEALGAMGFPGGAGNFNAISQNGIVGFGLTFAKEYLAAGKLTPGATGVLLVPSAVDASGFASGFNGTNVGFSGGWVVPPASNFGGNFWQAAINQANAATATNGSNNFKGILWQNMENEMLFLSNVSSGNMAANLANLLSALEAMIAYFRAHIIGASGTTPFICGQATQASIANWNSASVDGSTGTEVDAVYAGIGGSVSHAAYFFGASPSTAGSANVNPNGQDGGSVHFNGAGQRINGQNCYNAYLTAV